MKTQNNSDCGCGLAGTIFGIIAGVIVGVLFALGLTPLIAVGLWVAFGIGSFAFIFLLGAAVLNSCDSSCNFAGCLRRNLKCLLIGSLGTIILTLILLSAALEILSVTIIILVALATFFLVFLIASFVSFLKCAVFHR